MPGKQNNDAPESFIITDMIPPLSAVRLSFQPAFWDFIPPTSPGNVYDAPSPITSDLDASLIPPSMVLSSHLGTHLQTTGQLRDNLDQKFPGLTTHAFLNCNMPGPNQRASNSTP